MGAKILCQSAQKILKRIAMGHVDPTAGAVGDGGDYRPAATAFDWGREAWNQPREVLFRAIPCERGVCGGYLRKIAPRPKCTATRVVPASAEGDRAAARRRVNR